MIFLGNEHKNGYKFYDKFIYCEESKLKSKGLVEKQNFDIGSIETFYNEKNDRKQGIKKNLSPDNEIAIKIDTKEIFNIIFSKLIDKNSLLNLPKCEISLMVELERNGISGAKNDIEQYKTRTKPFNMVKLPVIVRNLKNSIGKRLQIEENLDINLNLIESKRFEEYC